MQAKAQLTNLAHTANPAYGPGDKYLGSFREWVRLSFGPLAAERQLRKPSSVRKVTSVHGDLLNGRNYLACNNAGALLFRLQLDKVLQSSPHGLPLSLVARLAFRASYKLFDWSGTRNSVEAFRYQAVVVPPCPHPSDNGSTLN